MTILFYQYAVITISFFPTSSSIHKLTKRDRRAEQPDPQLVASVVDEDSAGITIRGAKMLATSGVMANELLVSGFQALQAGDEAYAFTAAVPLAAKGLTLMSRRSYEQKRNSAFDYPLSSRFDENDAIVYFDDVKIPWDRVFVCKRSKDGSGAVARHPRPRVSELSVH